LANFGKFLLFWIFFSFFGKFWILQEQILILKFFGFFFGIFWLFLQILAFSKANFDIEKFEFQLTSVQKAIPVQPEK
jgi:hypothetical protein